MSWYTKALVAVLSAWFAAPETVTAQLGRPQLGVAAGATFPSGNFDTGLWGFKTGWQGMAFVAFRIRHSPLTLRLDGSYGVNTSSEPINGAPAERRVGLLGGDADLTFTVPSSKRTKFYLLVGPGLYRVSNSLTKYFNGPYSSSDTKFAYNLGWGFTVGALFVEARYVHVDGFGNSISWIFFPITAGLRFGSR
jgi:hypothetical protein